MRTRESFLALIAELEGDYRELGRVMSQNNRAWERIQGGSSDPLDWGALGFTLHSAYGILENYFQRVELLKFRHRFRNLYGEDLDPEKTAEVHRIANSFADSFSDSHASFIAKLRAIAEELK